MSVYLRPLERGFSGILGLPLFFLLNSSPYSRYKVLGPNQTLLPRESSGQIGILKLLKRDLFHLRFNSLFLPAPDGDLEFVDARPEVIEKAKKLWEFRLESRGNVRGRTRGLNYRNRNKRDKKGTRREGKREKERKEREGKKRGREGRGVRVRSYKCCIRYITRQTNRQTGSELESGTPTKNVSSF